MPSEPATMPQQRKLRIQPRAITGKPVHIRFSVAAAVFIAVEAGERAPGQADGYSSHVSIPVRAPSAF
jgi:hypothetical protein